MSTKIKDIIECVIMALFLIFTYGVASYYDTKVYNEMYGATATTEIHYGEDYGE